jgi:serine/threonine-protein kinase
MRVGPWRIVDARGRGTYGSVYLVEGAAAGAAGLAALKVAHHPWDERFGREAELLSRLCHPCVPRLLGHGQWLSPAGLPHPWLALELVDGIPLYEWARAFVPSSRQVLGVLAGLAGALAATHAEGGIHRDVKGGNVLVRLEDGRGFLVDFGSGSYRGAAPLTTQGLPPGTAAYRSPEAFGSAPPSGRGPVLGPADDLFALGVTAWRLVTGAYPPSADPVEAESRVWSAEGPGAPPAREVNPRCAPELSALAARLLSVRPEARGSARELAEALERAAREASPEADAPLFAREDSGPLDADELPRYATRRSWRPWLAAAGLAGPVALGALWALSNPGRWEAARAAEADPVAVGDSTPTAPGASVPGPSGVTPIGLDMPSKPLSGQIRPDANGRCPRPPMVAINGGCWIKTDEDPKQCGKYSYVYKGGCYEPAAPLRPPVSGPTDAPDGG